MSDTDINIVLWALNIGFCIYIIVNAFKSAFKYRAVKSKLSYYINFYNAIVHRTNSQIQEPIEQKIWLNIIKEIRSSSSTEEERPLMLPGVLNQLLSTEGEKFKQANSLFEQLSTLGLLGTVAGLSFGFWFFDGSNMNLISASFQTALWTTFFGLASQSLIRILGWDVDAESKFEEVIGKFKHMSEFVKTNPESLSEKNISNVKPETETKKK